MDGQKVPSLESISAERHALKMEASRLEAAILQTIIRHAQENHTATEAIILALLNCTLHWQHHTTNAKISKMLYNELNGKA